MQCARNANSGDSESTAPSAPTWRHFHFTARVCMNSHCGSVASVVIASSALVAALARRVLAERLPGARGPAVTRAPRVGDALGLRGEGRGARARLVREHVGAQPVP